MSDTGAFAIDDLSAPVPRQPPFPLPRWFAAAQVFAVCGIPSGIFVVIVMFLFGRPMPVDLKHPPLEFFASVGLFDAALVALLIKLFLWMSGENSSDVFLGRRRIGREVARGLLLLPLVFFGIMAFEYGLQRFLPALHNVKTNPLSAYMNTPVEAAVFIIVVILAGGVREELSRAFILHRFAQRLGGARVGLVLFSLVFGALHFDQGYDVMISVGILGAIWGLLYVRRRSVVASMVNHASFDVAQVLLQLLGRSLGV